MRIVYLDKTKLRSLCYEMAEALAEMYGYPEPMPRFGNHNPAKLEAALHRPRSEAFGVKLYPDLDDKAAVLFYSIVKYHAFENGNKRVGVAALLAFLRLNGFDFKKDFESILTMARKVARSNRTREDKVVTELKNWITKNKYPLSK